MDMEIIPDWKAISSLKFPVPVGKLYFQLEIFQLQLENNLLSMKSSCLSEEVV